jgi:hypothetical protein
VDLYKNFENRILFMMKYDSSKTSKENSIFLSEQPTLTSTDIKFIETDSPNKYPNYCAYPEKAILPGKNEVGVYGLEAIPQGYCCYPIPMPESKSGGLSYIFLPQDATIEFWNEVSYNHLFKNTLKLSEKESVKYIDYYLKIFPYGSVFSFEVSGLTYVSWMQYERGSKFGEFKWFFTDNERKQPYPKVEWTDPRTKWDKIVDDYGDVAQWVTSAAFFISGFFTQGGTWLLLAEMVTEGSLAIITAQRSLEKGENLSAAFDLLFGLTPFLKTGRIFTGIDPKVVTSLIRSMKRARLSSSSTPQEIITWYMTLGEVEKKAWSKMVKAGEEFSESKLKKVLGESLDGFKDYLKLNPGAIKNIKFYQNVNLREFSISSIIGLVGILAEAFYGEELNDEEKGKLAKIYNNANKISKELAEEVKLNAIYNADKIKEILNSEPTTKMLQELDLMPEGKPHPDWFNTEFKNVIESGEGTYMENPSDSSKTVTNLETSNEEILKYESEGYKKGDDMTDEEWGRAKKPIKLNGVWFYKIR